MFYLQCNSKISISYDGYNFSFPMKVEQAESLFHLNKKIFGNRSVRLDAKGCKEIQITYEKGTLGFNDPEQVDAVSFYHHEDVLVLKEKLERIYGKKFEPVSVFDGGDVHYYKMKLEGPVTLLIYANTSNICAQQKPGRLEEKPKTRWEIARNMKVSVVAFTYNLESRRHFNYYITSDGFYRYSAD